MTNELQWTEKDGVLIAQGHRTNPYVISGKFNSLELLDVWSQDFSSLNAAKKVAQSDRDQICEAINRHTLKHGALGREKVLSRQ